MPRQQVGSVASLLLWLAVGGCQSQAQEPSAASPSRAGAGEQSAFGGNGGSAGIVGGAPSGGKASGQEANCSDGLDNDTDGLTDCRDPDCTAACKDSCTAAAPLTLPAYVAGDLSGHASHQTNSCGAVSESGAEVVYSVVVPNAGTLVATLSSKNPMTLALRGSCTSAKSEQSCGSQRLIVPVKSGETWSLLVDALTPSDAGTYALSVRIDAAACGNARLEGFPKQEQCDDGGTTSGDGCSATCQLEAIETEPNDTSASASESKRNTFGMLETAGDVDFYKVIIPVSGQFSAGLSDLGDGACTFELLDSELALLSPTGDVRAVDDDGGDGRCSRLQLSQLTAGPAVLRVRAAPRLPSGRFPYLVTISSPSLVILP